jgi:tRNA (uracil-5-)-methyltransferase
MTRKHHTFTNNSTKSEENSMKAIHSSPSHSSDFDESSNTSQLTISNTQNSVIPKCPYFGKCGGCNCQHISYQMQLQNKSEQVKHLVGADKVNVFSDSDYGYRNRMDVLFHSGGLGFRKSGDWKTIISIDSCAISNLKLNELLVELKNFFAKQTNLDVFDQIRKKGTFRYAVIRTPSQSSTITFVLNQDSTKISEATHLLESFCKITTAQNIIIAYVPANSEQSISEEYYVMKGSDMLKEHLCGKEFLYHSQGFFQNNTKMAEKMLCYVRSIFESYDTTKYHLLDLYGGVGTFGLVCNDLFESTVVVEDFAGSIDIAKKNILLNGQKNMTAIVKDAMYLHNVKLPDPLMVITDPPRSGMHQKTIATLLKLEPDVIVYISCNPKQMARELIQLKTKYSVKSTSLFDLFPQTNHMEVVVELVRKNSIFSK